MTINLFRSNKSDYFVDSTPEQSRRFAVESDGTGDDLDGFISVITTIAQSQCERCEAYADVEALVCQLPIDHLTFAAHDSLAPCSGPYPMAQMVQAFLLEEINDLNDTAVMRSIMSDRSDANESSCNDAGCMSVALGLRLTLGND